MTFRTRLVLVATGAVLVVVLLASVATYVVAYNSLVGSIDTTLEQDRPLPHRRQRSSASCPRSTNTCGRAGGYCSQMVWADGHVNPGDPQVLPITPQTAGHRRQPRHRRPSCSSPPTSNGISVREIVSPVGPGYRYSNGTDPRRAGHALRRGAAADRAADRRPRGPPPPGRRPLAHPPRRRRLRRAARPRGRPAPCCARSTS